MDMRKLVRLSDENSGKLTDTQTVMGNTFKAQGFTLYVESYSDYTYLVCLKEGVKNGVKRINATGHDTYIN